MIDTLKKTILAGLGAATVTKEKVQEGLEDLVKKGKITAEEARELAEKMANEGRQEFDKASAKLGEKLREVLSFAGDKNLERIAELEARIAALEGSSPKGAKHKAKS